MLCCFVQSNAQQRTCIAGLEGNAEYMRLVGQEERLVRTSDSISESMNAIRRTFRTDTLNRAANSAAILRMEEETFDMRERMAAIAGRINAIEQEWILRSFESRDGDGMQSASANGSSATPADNSPEAFEDVPANFVYNPWFARNLSPEHLAELHRAQELESEIPDLVADHIARHATIRGLAADYERAVGQAEADSIEAELDFHAVVNLQQDELIGELWGIVFDGKTYIYNYLMDKENRVDMLERYVAGMETLRQARTEQQGMYASDAIADYILQKKFITDCELRLAGELRFQSAADSLKKVIAALPEIAELGLEPVRLTERLFLDYADIATGQSPYNSADPIPQTTVYPKGIIYRVLLGAFSSAQQPSVFRGVSPLSVQKGPDNKFRYFAGGFATDSTALAAVERMKDHGFRAPQPVVWMDGVYINLADGKGLGDGFYRVELSGGAELSPEVREVIRTVTGGKPIVRGEGMFIVGPLDNAAEAARLRTALDSRDPEMTVKIVEMAQ